MLPARAQSIAVPVKIAALAAIALNVVALAACVSKCALPIVVNVVICFQIIQNFKMLLTKSAPHAIGGTGQLFFVRLSCKYSYKTTSLCASFSLVVLFVIISMYTPVRNPPIAMLSSR